MKRKVRPRGASAVHAEINVTPLVDVVLVLLIIFMVVTPFLHRGVPVALPFAAHASHGQAPRGALLITINREGKTWVGDRQIAGDRLTGAVRSALLAQPDRAILVEGDRGVRYGAVRRLLVRLRGVGAEGVELATAEQRKKGR